MSQRSTQWWHFCTDYARPWVWTQHWKPIKRVRNHNYPKGFPRRNSNCLISSWWTPGKSLVRSHNVPRTRVVLSAQWFVVAQFPQICNTHPGRRGAPETHEVNELLVTGKMKHKIHEAPPKGHSSNDWLREETQVSWAAQGRFSQTWGCLRDEQRSSGSQFSPVLGCAFWWHSVFESFYSCKWPLTHIPVTNSTHSLVSPSWTLM